MTVVCFGNSMPKLLLAVASACRRLPDIAIGNIVGTNMGNVQDITARLAPVPMARRLLRFDLPVRITAPLC